jgi:hypothetical protein
VKELPSAFRRLVIGHGVEPGRCTATCPTTLQEAKPKAGSFPRPNVRRRNGSQTGVKAQKSTPSASPAGRFCRSCNSNRRSVTPTKINRGGRRGTNGRWARTGRNAERKHNGVPGALCEASMTCPPECGSKPAKGRLNPMNAVGRRRETIGKTCVVRPGSAMPQRVAERHAKKARFGE